MKAILNEAEMKFWRLLRLCAAPEGFVCTKSDWLKGTDVDNNSYYSLLSQLEAKGYIEINDCVRILQ